MSANITARPAALSNYLELSNVDFAYRDRPILHGVNLRIAKGGVTALMGGSGSGKTTLLRLITGQVRANAGEVQFDGQNVGALDRDGLYQLRRKIGVLFQQGALFTDLNVFDNVAFPLREQTKLPESMIRDLVHLKLHSVGLRGAAGLRTSQLSGGMARRVALARSIALDPPLLLYDEPFAGLDPISLGTIAQLIRRLNDALGATSIMVTHDVAETFAVADYVYLLGQGRIVAHGTPDDLRKTTEPFARQFFDALADGPVSFHYPADAIEKTYGLDSKGGG